MSKREQDREELESRLTEELENYSLDDLEEIITSLASLGIMEEVEPSDEAEAIGEIVGSLLDVGEDEMRELEVALPDLAAIIQGEETSEEESGESGEETEEEIQLTPIPRGLPSFPSRREVSQPSSQMPRFPGEQELAQPTVGGLPSLQSGREGTQPLSPRFSPRRDETQGLPRLPTIQGATQPTSQGLPRLPTSQGLPRLPTSQGLPRLPTIQGATQPTSQGLPRLPTSQGLPRLPTIQGATQPTNQGLPRLPTNQGANQTYQASPYRRRFGSPIEELRSLKIQDLREMLRELSNKTKYPYKPGRSKETAITAILNLLPYVSPEQAESIDPLLLDLKMNLQTAHT